ncbi:MAG: phosphoribosyl-AMP cyclohydrolase [Candidatus Sumerlaeaceae bacterium]|nr:phosphoribosyl-AMP cyclohydrolase [Candidatus Sumerlaeaceae bacterium]
MYESTQAFDHITGRGYSPVDAAKLLERVKFDDRGLIAAVVQDHETGEVLMVAWMNLDALKKTLEEERAWYWSRSRQKLWLKGESSGHIQTVKEVRLDCDGDAVVLKVSQEGGACHTGYRSCFYRKATEIGWVEEGQRVFDPESVYKHS